MKLATAWLLVQTARLWVRLRLRGMKAGLVTCEGRLPVLITGGDCTLGRVALRGSIAPIELGAEAGGRLAVGDRVFINQGASLVAAHSITIGDDSRIGDFVAIYDSDHHPLEEGRETRSAAVTVGRNVWIARGAIILPGVTIGDHAVIGAGAVVTDDVPARTLVAGNPARVVRTLEAGDQWKRG